MIGVTAVEAGRIRDAARVARVSGLVLIASFVVSFFWDPAIFGFGAWPLGFLLVALASIPLLRARGPALVALVTAVAVVGGVLSLVGLLMPPSGTTFRLGNLFGAGIIANGAWFIGAGATIREPGGFHPDVGKKMIRGGAGLAIVGASWFIDDAVISLLALLVGAILSGGIDPFLKQARRFGLTAPTVRPPVAEPES